MTNQAGFASHRGVSRKTVTGWKQRGLLVFSEDGRVDIVASDQALRDHGILLPSERLGNSSADHNGGADDLAGLLTMAEAERKKEIYAALLRRLEYERASAEVVLVSDAAMIIRSEFSIVRERLGAISTDLVPHLVGLRSPEEIKAVIDAAIRQALTELSDIVP